MARKVVAEFDAIDGPFLNKLRAIDRSIGRFEHGALSAFGRVEKGVSGLLATTSKLSAVTGALAGGFAANMAAQFVDTSTRMHNMLNSIGQDTKQTFDGIYLAATRSLSPIDKFTEAAVRMQKAMDGKQGMDQSIRQIETLNKLLALGGKSATERESTLLQFTQALQAGALQGDEMRSLRENAPIELMRAMAKAAGGGIEDLKKFSMEGKITTAVMIEALDSLAATADKRMSEVKLTIADGATAMRNGALIAAEGFDKGLGLSRAATTGLKALGDLLGSNAEAARIFGEAVKIAGIAMGVAWGGRAVNSNLAALRAVGPALREVAASTAAVAAADYKGVQAKAAKVASIEKQIAAMQLEGASAAKLKAAYATLDRAQITSAAALTRYGASAKAASVAQERLAFTARATAAAGSVLRGAWAFLGGWPGLIMLAGAAFLTVQANVESASEKFTRLTTDTGAAATAADALKDVQDRLNDAIEEAGTASDAAHSKIVANTLSEMGLKRDALQFERDALQAMQGENQRLSNLKRREAEEAAQRVAQLKAQQQALLDSGDNIGAANLNSSLAVAMIQQRQLNAEAEKLENVFGLAAIRIQDYDAILAQANLNLAKATVLGIDLAGALETAQSWAASLAATAPAGSWMSAAIASITALIGRLSTAVGLKALLTNSSAGPGPSFENKGRSGSTLPPPKKDTPTLDELIAQGAGKGGSSGSSGGSSGGKSDAEKGRDEALRFIEQMMTKEERRAKQIKEMTDLRTQLVATYGPEAAIVGQLDEAIRRAMQDTEELNNGMKQFFDTLSDQIASSIEDWQGWGSFVRSVLASLVSQYGVDFFTALLTPGAQHGKDGDSLGTILGNWITGKANGGPVSAGTPYVVGERRPELFVPRQSGTIIPNLNKLGGGGGGVTVMMPVDMRGVDESMKPYIDGRMKMMEREFPGRVVAAVKSAQNKRQL